MQRLTAALQQRLAERLTGGAERDGAEHRAVAGTQPYADVVWSDRIGICLLYTSDAADD